MKVLVIGSGGREHAIAWKVSQSPLLSSLYMAPGNAGMADLGELVPLEVGDGKGILLFAQREKIDLVVIGPEAALAAGVSDILQAGGITVFGPSKYAAQMETSKRFAKEFMQQHGIPTARFNAFSDYAQACLFLRSVTYPYVIKASGLASGKGVFLPDSLREGLDVLRAIMVDREFGASGDEVIIEERLEGDEVSLLAFSDGKKLAVMPPAQDHKRLLDDDEGPNTGGMGAYAPAPALFKDEIAEISRTILQPVLDGLRADGHPYIGVLYAGLMLTKDGPKVLEFNARFGDPETQAILPLLETDLLEIFKACTRGELDGIKIRWAERSAVCVALASEGYPAQARTGLPIQGLDTPMHGGIVFHAATSREDGRFITAGGRVLGVTCWDVNLRKAIERAYQMVSQISFPGMQYRKDIGKKGLDHICCSYAYRSAGVDIDAGNRTVELMSEDVRSTYNPRVLSGIGSFGGLFDADDLGEQPVLVASTDGVGTKVELAARLERYHGIGEDIVNHCIDDILVQGARPLFFMDYFAASKLQPDVVAEIVAGMTDACKAADCALLGGETAEMPGVYCKNAFDIAGTIVGVIQRGRILPQKDTMLPGDLLVGFASSGAHTNGYSLIRKVCDGEDLLTYREELKSNLADVLLTPHRSYLHLLEPLLPFVKGFSHITGGGFKENIPRMLPDGLKAVIDRSAWPQPALFNWLQKQGEIDPQEMYRVFNMGIGLVAVINPQDWAAVQAAVNEPVWQIGELTHGPRSEVVLK
jgi:phosphoribosylamine--glycine ligase/phosphoribosylaminoimidazole synthetase